MEIVLATHDVYGNRATNLNHSVIYLHWTCFVIYHEELSWEILPNAINYFTNTILFIGDTGVSAGS